MGALVIKSWKIDNKPVDSDGSCIKIIGRQGGLIAWILSWMGVDPTTTLLVSMERIDFSDASLAGTQSRLIPLQNVCSSYYGYHKPWKVALGIIAFFVWIGSTLSRYDMWPLITCTLIGIIIGLIYYFLNRTLTLGFVENSGVVIGIRFKRSVIENVDINQIEAKHVCKLLQDLIEKKIGTINS